MVKKYELCDPDEVTGLHRIRALENFFWGVGDKDRVFAGDYGGWVSGEHNLVNDVDDVSWVFKDSVVKDNAVVKDGSVVSKYSVVKDEAVVSKLSVITRGSVVGGSARVVFSVCDKASVVGNAYLDNSSFRSAKADGFAVVENSTLRDVDIYGKAVVKRSVLSKMSIFGKVIIERVSFSPGNKEAVKLFSDRYYFVTLDKTDPGFWQR